MELKDFSEYPQNTETTSKINNKGITQVALDNYGKLMSKEELDIKLQEAVRRITTAMEVERIYLFGSYAYGEPHNGSDIDLYVIVPDIVTHKRIYVIADLIKTVYGNDTTFNMDVDIIAHTKSNFIKASNDINLIEYEVANKGVVLYDRNKS